MKREVKFSLVFRDMWQSAGKYQPRVDQLVKVAPEEVVPAKKSAKPASTIDGGTMAILQEVVSQITGGKGKVASAKKI